MPGRFITFEGGEGSGKTTQIQLLRDALVRRGYTVVTTREPGGEPIAEAIRRELLRSKHPIVPQAELLLFLAARAQVVQHVIAHGLGAADAVICDRFMDSTVVYQGHARGLDLDLVRRLNLFATNGLVPHLTILLDLDPAVGLSRQTDWNRMEQESVDFHRNVRRGYLAEAQREPERWLILDASEDPETIHRQVLAACLRLMNADSSGGEA
jgi:dTMP kinase